MKIQVMTLQRIDDGVLMCVWYPPLANGMDWAAVRQVVMPKDYLAHVLVLAHENKWSGHLGVKKTNNLILNISFWPRMKTEVVAYY